MVLKQPMTAKQISRHTNLSEEACSAALLELFESGLVECLNPKARRSRLYRVVETARSLQKEVRQQIGLEALKHDYPEVDWELYGSVLYSHRLMILRTLAFLLTAFKRPFQPAEIRRKARFNDPRIRMSANNVRDVLREMKAMGIVRKAAIKGKWHSGYELTELGWKLEELRFRAESVDTTSREGGVVRGQAR